MTRLSRETKKLNVSEDDLVIVPCPQGGIRSADLVGLLPLHAKLLPITLQMDEGNERAPTTLTMTSGCIPALGDRNSG